MKTYQSHKRVKAARIEAIKPGPINGKPGDILVLEDGEEYFAPASMTVRYTPLPGDYLVEYQGDGYRSISPRAAFENGYTLVEG